MFTYDIILSIAIVQILVSIFLVKKRKNTFASITEVALSILLFLLLINFKFTLDASFIFKLIVTFGEYLFVKIFLVVYFLIVRIYCFNFLKVATHSHKKLNMKQKSYNSKLRRIRIYSKIKYWPKLKLGLPGMTDKTNAVTKIKFDSNGFPIFKSIYTVKIPRKFYHTSRERHFIVANYMLYSAALRNSRIRCNFSNSDMKQLSIGSTPSKYTWHHHQDSGVLQLVNRNIHAKTPHIGGYSIWGSK